jgi:hypothetical protein
MKFPSNLRNHLKIHHADIFKLVEAEGRKITEASFYSREKPGTC